MILPPNFAGGVACHSSDASFLYVLSLSPLLGGQWLGGGSGGPEGPWAAW